MIEYQSFTEMFIIFTIGVLKWQTFRTYTDRSILKHRNKHHRYLLSKNFMHGGCEV